MRARDHPVRRQSAAVLPARVRFALADMLRVTSTISATSPPLPLRSSAPPVAARPQCISAARGHVPGTETAAQLGAVRENLIGPSSIPPPVPARGSAHDGSEDDRTEALLQFLARRGRPQGFTSSAKEGRGPRAVALKVFSVPGIIGAFLIRAVVGRVDDHRTAGSDHPKRRRVRRGNARGCRR